MMQLFTPNRWMITLALLLSCTWLVAQPNLSGSETLVNSTTTESQQNPAVAMDTAGNFVVVWESYGEDGDDYGIFAQLYDNTGAPNGSQFQINSTSAGPQRFPDVAMDADGDFVVVWIEQVDDGQDIIRRMFDNTGSSTTSEFHIASVSNDETHPKVAMDADGNFYTVWTEDIRDGDALGIFGRPSSSNGATLSSAVQINTTTAGSQSHVDIARDSLGRCVVVWQSTDQDGDGNGVYFQRIDESNTLTGSETQVNVTTAGNQQEPTVAIDNNGNFVIAWSSWSQDGDQYGIYHQRFDNTGTAQTGADILTNTTTSGGQDHADIAMSTTGDFVIAWSSYGQDGNREGVYLQAYKADGTADGTESRVNDRTTDFQQAAAMGWENGEDALAIAWMDGLRNSASTHDGDDYGVYMKYVDVKDTTPPTAVCQNITAYLDGSGNVTVNAVDVDGGSTDNCGVTGYSLNTSSFTCANIGSNSVILTVQDEAGQVDLCGAFITVEDSAAPTAVCQDLTVYLDGTGSATVTGSDPDNGSTDNCSISSYALTTTAFTCSNIGANVETMTVTDGQGNSGTCSTTITVLDSAGPTAACQNLTVYIDGTGNANVTAANVDNGSTDNCSIASYALSTSTFTCSEIGANAVTLTVTDPGGNTGNCAATITVQDTTSPTAVCQNISVYLDGTGNATITTGDIDGGSTDNCGVSSLALNTSSFACADTGTNTITLTVTDDNSLQSTCTSTATVLDSVSPTAVCQNISVWLDGTGSATITTGDIDNGSSDNCGVNSLALSTSNFTCADTGANAVTLTVADVSSNSGTCTGTVTVVDSTAPTATCQDITVYLDGTGSATLSGTDIDNGSSDNCSVNTLTASTTSFTCANIGANAVTLTVEDPSNNSSTCSSTVTVADSSAPTASCQNLSVWLDGTGSATITTGDVDGGSTDNCGSPSLSLNTTSFACANVGANTVTLTVNDGNGNSSTCTSTVTVVDSTAPTASCQNITAYLDGAGSATITTGDVDNGSADNCGVNLALSTTTYTCADTGANTVTLTVTDPSSNTDNCTATVTVLDTIAPTATCQNITTYLDGSGSATITAGDIDNGSSDNCTSGGSLSIDINTFTCADTGANTVTLTFTDIDNNTSTCTGTVTVIDSSAPTASCQNITAYLDGTGSVTITTGDIDNGSSDNCAVASLALNTTTFGCTDVGANSVTLTVADVSSNQSTCTGTVTVVDSSAPVMVCQNATVYLDGSGNATISTGTIDNGSTDNCISTAVLTLSTTAFTCADTGANAVTLTGTDGSGNTDSCAATVTVLDTISPTATCQSLTVYLDGTGSATITTGDVDNGSADNCSISSLALNTTSFACGDTGANSVTLTVNDVNGNSSSCSATVTVVDSTAPTASCQNISVWLDGTGSATITTNDIDNGSTDNCASPTLSINTSSFSCGDIGANTVTLTVDDGSNQSTCTSTVTVVDSTSPTASCQNITAYLDGSGNATITTANVDNGSTDNCSVASLALNTTSFACVDTGANTVTMTVTDGSANTSTCTATVTVLDTVAPAASCQNLTVQLNGTGTATITAAGVDNGSTDNCGVNALSLNTTTFGCGDVGTNTVTLTVSDVSSNTGTCTATITVQDTIAPTASCSNYTAYLDASGSVTINASNVDAGSSDNCNIDTLTLSISTFSCADIGANTVTLTATDDDANTASCTATVTVLDTIAPTMACQNATVYLDGSGNATISAATIDGGSMDACGLQSLTAATTAFTCADTGANAVTLTAMDSSGNAGTCTATVTVLDTIAPTVACQSATVYLNAAGTATLTSSAVDAGNSDNCSVASLTLDVTTFACADTGANTVTLTAADPSGNTGACTATVTVLDTLAPAATCQNTTVYLGPGGIAPVSGSAVDGGSTDNCSLTLMAMPGNFMCQDTGMRPVTLLVTDGSGNQDSCVAQVTIQDTLPPTAMCKPDTVYLDTTGNASITPMNVNDMSGDNCGIATMTVAPNTFNAANIGPNTVTLTVTDVSGNVATCQETVTVLDTLANAIGDPDLSWYFDAFPNPTRDWLQVEASCAQCQLGGEFRLLLVDMYGHILFDETVALSTDLYETRIDMRDLSQANYILSLTGEHGRITKKILKY